MGKSIVRCQMQSRERRWLPLPALIGLMSLQPAIPWQVGLHQSPPPLHRPGSECVTVVVPVENFAANGQQCLIRLSQPRGPPQLQKLTRSVRSPQRLSLIEKALTSEIENRCDIDPDLLQIFPSAASGIPQGNTLSPLLANF